MAILVFLHTGVITPVRHNFDQTMTGIRSSFTKKIVLSLESNAGYVSTTVLTDCAADLAT